MELIVLGSAPCNGCDKRTYDCHPKCEEYLEWVTKKRNASIAIRRYEKAKGYLVDNQMDRAARMQRGFRDSVKMKNVWGR